MTKSKETDDSQIHTDTTCTNSANDDDGEGEDSSDLTDTLDLINNILKNLDKVIAVAGDKLVAYKKQEADGQREIRKQELESQKSYLDQISKRDLRSLSGLIIFLIGLIAFMSWLTWVDKVSGDALLFLVGTVVGSLIMFIEKITNSKRNSTLAS